MSDHHQHSNEESLSDIVILDRECHDQAATAGQPWRFRTSSIDWDKAKELALVQTVLRFDAHKKTLVKKEDKWIRVKEELFKLDIFRGFNTDCSPGNLSKKYERLVASVAHKFGLDREGANLSGLGSCEYTDMERLLRDMIVDNLETKREKEEISKKEREHGRTIITLKPSGLNDMNTRLESSSSVTQRIPARKRPFPVSTSCLEDDSEEELEAPLKMDQATLAKAEALREREAYADIERKNEAQQVMLSMMEAHTRQMDSQARLMDSQARQMEILCGVMNNVGEAIRDLASILKEKSKKG